jgi:hypothetical protein
MHLNFRKAKDLLCNIESTKSYLAKDYQSRYDGTIKAAVQDQKESRYAKTCHIYRHAQQHRRGLENHP